jgi:AraC-like DNA-binding protein
MAFSPRPGGIDFDELLLHLELSPEVLRGDSLKLTRKQLFSLWEYMIQRAGEPEFIFAVRDLTLHGRFDTVFYAGICSRDVRRGLRKLARVKETLFPFRLPLVEDASGLALGFDWFCHPAAVPQSFVLAEMIVCVAMVRFATGRRIIPARAALFSLPENPAPYEDWLGIPLSRSEQPELRFHYEDLDTPFETCNLEILKLLDHDLEKKAQPKGDSALDERVKQCIERCLASGNFTIEYVADSLGYSVRALQRSLTRLGTSYRKILFQARSELAQAYLKADLPLAEVSLLLGFEEINSLRRFLDGGSKFQEGEGRKALVSPDFLVSTGGHRSG